MAFPTIPTTGANTLLSSTTSTASTTHTFPSQTTLAPAAGDLLIAVCVQYQGGTSGNEFTAWGGSFTERADLATVTALDQAIGVATKVAAGGETGTFTATSGHSFKSVNFLMLIPAASWHGTTVPEIAAAVRATGAVANPGALSPSWGAADTLWIAVAGHSETSTTGSPPTLDTAPTNYSGSLIVARAADAVGDITAGVSFRQNNAASEDAGTWTVTNATRGNGIATTIAIRPNPTTTIPLQSADAVSTGAASVTAPTNVPLQSAAAASTTSASLTTPPLFFLAANAVSTATAAITTPASGILARSFDGVDDEIRMSIGSCNLTGAYTMAVLARRSLGVGMIYTSNNNSGGSVLIRNQAYLPGDFLSLNGASQSTFTIPDNKWVILAISKAAGTATPRLHVYEPGVGWTQQAGSATVGNPSTQAGGSVRFGAFGALAWYPLNIAVAAEWNVALSDAQVQELSTNWKTNDWAANSGGAPVGGWNFNQASVGTAITDFTGNGADQTFITGTTVDTDGPAGWDYTLAAAATIPLQSADATSTATAALSTATTIPLQSAGAVSSAAGALTAKATITLQQADAVSSTGAALTAKTTIPLQTAAAVSTATGTVLTTAQIPLATAAAVSTASVALTAKTTVPLQTAAAVSTASAALSILAGAATVPLQTAAAVSTSAATLSAKTTIPLGGAGATSTASLALAVGVRVRVADLALILPEPSLAAQLIPLDPANAQSGATADLKVPTYIPLQSADATSTATAAITARPALVLQTAAATSTASLAITALTSLTLQTAAATSTATAAITTKTTIPLQSADATSTATAAFKAITYIPLQTAAAISTASATLTSPTLVALQAAAATTTASVAFTAQTFLPLQSANAVSTASAAFTSATRIALQSADAVSTASLSLKTLTYVPLQTAAAVSSASIEFKARTEIPLSTAAAVSTASAAIGTEGGIPLSTADAVSTASLTLLTISPLPLQAANAQSGATAHVIAPHMFILPVEQPSWLVFAQPTAHVSLAPVTAANLLATATAQGSLGDATSILELHDTDADLELAEPTETVLIDG